MNVWLLLLSFIFGAVLSILFAGPWFERQGWRQGVKYAEMRPPEDIIDVAIERAISDYGGREGIFNAAGFSQAFMSLLGLRGGLDGNVVRGILVGRADILTLQGGAHFKRLTSSNSGTSNG